MNKEAIGRAFVWGARSIFMQIKGPSIPSLDLLMTAAPEVAWRTAISQAKRSPMIKFKCGAAIWDPSDERVIGKGCSNPDIQFSKMLASVHAEHHALRRSSHLDVQGCWIVLITFNGRGGCAWSSRPCYSCASNLYRNEIERVIYPERTKKGSWLVKTEHPEEMLSRALPPTGIFARQQRIPV